MFDKWYPRARMFAEAVVANAIIIGTALAILGFFR